jgi:hypothetical protein
MNQELFSKQIQNFLQLNFPEFLVNLKHDNNGSFTSHLKNQSGIVSIWLTTENTEITIGLEKVGETSEIHTHISCYEPQDIEECCASIKDYISQIKSDRLVLYKKANGNYDWGDYSKLDPIQNSTALKWSS